MKLAPYSTAKDVRLNAGGSDGQQRAQQQLVNAGGSDGRSELRSKLARGDIHTNAASSLSE